MKTKQRLLKNSVLLGVIFFMLGSRTLIMAQTEITVEPNFNSLYYAVIANPGATLILQRGEDYINDTALPITAATIIKAENEPSATRPALIRFFANPGGVIGKSMFDVSANFVLQDVGIIGTTFDEHQISYVFNILANGIDITIDGCFFQNCNNIFWSGLIDRLTLVEKNNIFFNLAHISFDSSPGGGFQWGGDSIDYKAYNNTYFICNRVFNTAGTGPNGSERMEHNSYVATWGETYFPITDKDVVVKNNIFYDSQIKGYVGPRYSANGDPLWGGDYSDWTPDSLSGDVAVYPHLNDSVGDPRAVIIRNNLKMYSGHVLDFYAANKVTPQTFFNVTGYKYAQKYGWDVKDNMLQENGNAVDPQFASGPIPDVAYELMFKQRIERSLPAEQQGPDYPYYWAWIPEGKTKADFLWPFPLDLKPTNEALWHAGDDGYPLGDLNWFGPEVVAAWEAGYPSGIGEIKSVELNLKNYPNPFSSSTLISYTLPIQDKVSLTVFNAAGVKVASLVNATQSAGNYEVTYNSANLAGGLYFYKLQTGGLSQMQKMILAK